jgi:hypothetical protein
MKIDDLEQQIDVTRREIDQTLYALQARLSPTRRLKAALGATQAAAPGVVRTGLAWAISHPVSVFAIGAALVWAVCGRPEARRGGA